MGVRAARKARAAQQAKEAEEAAAKIIAEREAAEEAAAKAAWKGCFLFDIMDEVFPMRVERDDDEAEVLPQEVLEMWEQWGVKYASRIKFEAPKEQLGRWLNPRSDPLPRPPATTRLLGNVSGVEAVLRALKLELGARK